MIVWYFWILSFIATIYYLFRILKTMCYRNTKGNCGKSSLLRDVLDSSTYKIQYMIISLPVKILGVIQFIRLEINSRSHKKKRSTQESWMKLSRFLQIKHLSMSVTKTVMYIYKNKTPVDTQDLGPPCEFLKQERLKDSKNEMNWSRYWTRERFLPNTVHVCNGLVGTHCRAVAMVVSRCLRQTLFLPIGSRLPIQMGCYASSSVRCAICTRNLFFVVCPLVISVLWLYFHSFLQSWRKNELYELNSFFWNARKISVHFAYGNLFHLQ